MKSPLVFIPKQIHPKKSLERTIDPLSLLLVCYIFQMIKTQLHDSIVEAYWKKRKYNFENKVTGLWQEDLFLTPVSNYKVYFSVWPYGAVVETKFAFADDFFQVLKCCLWASEGHWENVGLKLASASRIPLCLFRWVNLFKVFYSFLLFDTIEIRNGDMKNWLIDYSCLDVPYLRCVVCTGFFFFFFLSRYQQNKGNLIRTRIISHTDKDMAGD